MLLTKEIFSIVLQTKHFLLLLKQIHIEDLITNDPKADIVSLRRSGQSLAGALPFRHFSLQSKSKTTNLSSETFSKRTKLPARSLSYSK
ncbi:Hypothetical protein EfmE4452_0509 [Enterococcus faecium E4452]|nr:Hypothetical protein EfmE4453_1104 [Enterococcus faecium E4453]EHM34092.1 Hypothetical protein EfmE4452_0509 [Enterococcus faecium E4452]